MMCLFGAGLRAQAPANDTCAAAIPIGNAVVIGSNVGATAGTDPLPSCQTVTGDVWYSWVAPCNGTWTVSTCAAATDFATVVSVWDGSAGCGSLTELACSDVCAAGPFLGSSASFMPATGTLYLISVGGNSGAAGNFALSVSLGASMSVSFFSNGPGALGYIVTQGPVNGTAFVAITLQAGIFPFGWFFGVDIQWVELLNEISTGYPFMVPLQPCGWAVVGPFAGLPPGLTLYAVGLGLPLGGSIPSATTLPVIGVVP